MRDENTDQAMRALSSDEASGTVDAETGLLRATLLFAAIAVGLALIVAPAARDGVTSLARNIGPDLDRMTTGSVAPPRQYTVRRSVLETQDGRHCVVSLGTGATRPC